MLSVRSSVAVLVTASISHHALALVLLQVATLNLNMARGAGQPLGVPTLEFALHQKLLFYEKTSSSLQVRSLACSYSGPQLNALL